VETLIADVNDEAAIRRALGTRNFDVVVDFIAFTAEQVERDIRLFKDRTAQYVFISSASAYRKPPVHHVITESTPVINPFWDYSRNENRRRKAFDADLGTNGLPHNYYTALPHL